MKIVPLAILTLALAACGTQPETPAKSGTAQMANPASVYCGQLGGKLEIAKDKDGGEVGYCTLPSGERVEEWTLFRRDHK